MITPQKLKLLIFNDYFYPAYKAGGPIQSLVNLISHLDSIYDIYVISSAFDLNEKLPMENVAIGKWVDVTLPGSNSTVKVWYARKNENIKTTIKTAVESIKPSVVYINGIFTYRYVILPLILIRNIKLVVCPRGMIQAGALSGKFLKKIIYLTILRVSGFTKNIFWHATSEIESDDIKKIFGKHSRVLVAGNIPKKPVGILKPSLKTAGELRLIYLSLISSKKNLMQAIEAVLACKSKVTLHIYGPVKDENYWARCENLIKRSNNQIVYKGDVIPELVQETFQNYDAGIFLTKAENFGHALYECISAGRPIITSYFTPWNQLETRTAGWNVNLEDITSVIQLLENIAKMDSLSFDAYCKGAHLIAKNYYENGFDISQYYKLFSISSE